ncbi:hypothetical protein [Bradyrhizobium zhanjiangense]|uniref:hypothetical protein n=1 Tax=Bradyrhizobium zhanjiangense TaxID=1325107 RepID=UPI0013E8A313|nr:hypothetical protein [Bradyrhizobium zhanjiangense]
MPKIAHGTWKVITHNHKLPVAGIEDVNATCTSLMLAYTKEVRQKSGQLGERGKEADHVADISRRKVQQSCQRVSLPTQP